MRHVQVAVPTGYLGAVERVLDTHGIQYVATEETSDRDLIAVVQFTLPTAAVEPVLDDLHEAGLDRDEYTIVLEASTVISEQFAELQERWATPEVDDRIARAELQSKADELLPSKSTFFLMTAISAVVATAGVLMDSAAVVVGSMVIAPLVGPALAASVGTVLDDHELSWTGIRWQVLGVLLAVGSATAFALLIRYVHLVPPGIGITDLGQVRERLSPDFLALAIALGAGIAGALSLSTGVSAALVGVMIAVALIPPAAVIGIGVAWGLPTVVLGSTVLLILNLVAINLAALSVLWYLGYRPATWFRIDDARSQIVRRGAFLVVAILVISVFLGGATYASYQSAIQEEAIDDAVTAVLDDPAYSEVHLVDFDVERDDGPLLSRPSRVIVTVSRPTNSEAPPLAERIRAELADRLEHAPAVEVRYIRRERAG